MGGTGGQIFALSHHGGVTGRGGGGYLSGVVITLPIESLFAFLFSIDPNCRAVEHDSSREAG